MASKKHVSYQWRIFIPCTVCLWVVIFGMFQWHVMSVQEVRNEMAFDQLNVIGNHLVEYYEDADTAAVRKFARFSNKFYDNSEKYDELTTWIINTETDSVTLRTGNMLKPDFPLPIEKSGTFVADKEYICGDSASDTKFIYSVYVTPQYDRKIYVMLPYTKRLTENINSRVTYYWLIFVAIGLFVTILLFISISYFGRNIRMLKAFSYQASSNPNFIPPSDIAFSNDELGDISRQILEIYKQRMVELEKREKEHKVAINAIEEKNRIKRELTGNVNHELKTPIGIVQGNIETLVRNPDMDDETRNKFIKRTYDNVMRLSELMRDLTAITRLESGGKLLNICEVNLHDLVFALESELKEGNILGDKMTFEYDIPLNCSVLGSENLLHTVLLNFIKNSVAYSGGTECHLIMTKFDDDFYYLKFFDNGVGVSPEHLPHLFERFYRVNSGRSRSTGGTGLGLAIVAVSIESLGGSIDVVNHFPSGLEFNFSIPKYKKKKA